MLTEKEKEVIQFFENFRKTIIEQKTFFNEDLTLNCGHTMFENITNLIYLVKRLNKTNDLFQEENNKLSNLNRQLTTITNNYNAYELPFTDDEDRIIIASKKYFNNGFFKNNFISKDKIKELEKTGYIEEECGYTKYVKIDDILRGESDEKL